VFENRVLRNIFGSKRDEVTGEWRKIHNKELNDLYSSSKIIHEECDGRCMWHVQETGELHVGLWWGDLGETDHSEGLVIEWRVILKWILKMWDRRSHVLD